MLLSTLSWRRSELHVTFRSDQAGTSREYHKYINQRHLSALTTTKTSRQTIVLYNLLSYLMLWYQVNQQKGYLAEYCEERVLFFLLTITNCKRKQEIPSSVLDNCQSDIKTKDLRWRWSCQQDVMWALTYRVTSCDMSRLQRRRNCNNVKLFSLPTLTDIIANKHEIHPAQLVKCCNNDNIQYFRRLQNTTRCENSSSIISISSPW